MKKVTTLLLGIMLISVSSIAQTSLYWNSAYFSQCNNGTISITPHVGSVPGLSPPDSSLPCSVIGQPVHDTLYFKNYTTFYVSGVSITVNSLKFDSIYLPAGLCWSTNHPNNTFTTGEDGIIYISGTPTGSAGSYKLRMIVDLNSSLGPFAGADLEALANFRYHTRIICSGNPCPASDPTDTISVFTADGSSCSGNGLYASITASGPTTLCPGDSVTLTANAGAGYLYSWSTGATSQSILVSATSSYGLTVYSGLDSAVASPINVNVLNSCALTASIIIGGPATICPGSSVPLIANSGPGYSYHWSTGDTTQSILANTAGSYSLTVFLGTDSAVAAAQNIVMSAPPSAFFQLSPDPNIPHAWVAVNQTTGVSGNVAWGWNWGDGSYGSGATPSHIYDSAGYYTICLQVLDSANNCSSSYCDSNVHLYKSDAQMVSLNVVLNPLVVNDIEQSILAIKYYASAINLSPPVNTPSEVKLYDMSGRVVMKQSNWLGSSLAVENISSGVYVVAIQNGSMNVSRKVLITR